MTNAVYQSPVDLIGEIKTQLFKSVKYSGKNNGAKYSAENREYTIAPNDNIQVELNDIKYKLVSYHFHTPSEHLIHGKRYPAELHQVFMQIDSENENENKNKITLDYCKNICCCNNKLSVLPNNPNINNIMVISRMILDGPQQDLRKMQLSVPDKFFVYDGCRTAPQFLPVRWIVGKKPICMSLEQILGITQLAREIQPLDGRLIIYQ
jgi:carbonic anhydrase